MDGGRETTEMQFYIKKNRLGSKNFKNKKLLLNLKLFSVCIYATNSSHPGQELSKSLSNTTSLWTWYLEEERRNGLLRTWTEVMRKGKGTVGVRRSKAGEGEADGPSWSKHLLPLLRCYCSGYGSLLTQRMGHRIFYTCFIDLLHLLSSFQDDGFTYSYHPGGVRQSLWIYLLFNFFSKLFWVHVFNIISVFSFLAVIFIDSGPRESLQTAQPFG